MCLEYSESMNLNRKLKSEKCKIQFMQLRFFIRQMRKNQMLESLTYIFFKYKSVNRYLKLGIVNFISKKNLFMFKDLLVKNIKLHFILISLIANKKFKKNLHVWLNVNCLAGLNSLKLKVSLEITKFVCTFRLYNYVVI